MGRRLTFHRALRRLRCSCMSECVGLPPAQMVHHHAAGCSLKNPRCQGIGVERHQRNRSARYHHNIAVGLQPHRCRSARVELATAAWTGTTPRSRCAISWQRPHTDRCMLVWCGSVARFRDAISRFSPWRVATAPLNFAARWARVLQVSMPRPAESTVAASPVAPASMVPDTPVGAASAGGDAPQRVARQTPTGWLATRVMNPFVRMLRRVTGTGGAAGGGSVEAHARGADRPGGSAGESHGATAHVFDDPDLDFDMAGPDDDDIPDLDRLEPDLDTDVVERAGQPRGRRPRRRRRKRRRRLRGHAPRRSRGSDASQEPVEGGGRFEQHDSAGDVGCNLAVLALKLQPLPLGSPAALEVRESSVLRPFPLLQEPASVSVKVDGLHAEFPSSALRDFIGCVDSSFTATFAQHHVPRASRAGGQHAVRVLCIGELRLHVYLLAGRRLVACVNRFVEALNTGGAEFGKGQKWGLKEHGNKGRARLVYSTRGTTGPYNARKALRLLLDAVDGTRGVTVLVRGFGQDAPVATNDVAGLGAEVDTWLSFLLQLHHSNHLLTAKSGVDICTEVTGGADESLMLQRSGAWVQLLPDGVQLFSKHGLPSVVDANGQFSSRARDRHMATIPGAPELLRMSKGVNFYSSQVYALPTRQHPALKCMDSMSPQQLSTRVVRDAVDKYCESFTNEVLDSESFRTFPLRLEVKSCNVGDLMSALASDGCDFDTMRGRALALADELVTSCSGGIVRVANDDLLAWCFSYHARLMEVLRGLATDEFRKSVGVLYQSLALEVALCSALRMWSTGIDHRLRGWQRHERVLELVGHSWKGEARSWVELQHAERCCFLEMPINLRDPSTNGLPRCGFPNKFNRTPTKGALGKCPQWSGGAAGMPLPAGDVNVVCTHTGWLLDALVMLVASAEAQELQLARERRFDRTCNDLQRLRARACALVLYLASALDFVLGVKAVPRFRDGLLVRSNAPTPTRRAFGDAGRLTVCHHTAAHCQSELLALSHSLLGDGVLGEGGRWDLMNIFCSKAVVLQLKPGADRVARGTLQVWASRLVELLATSGAPGRSTLLGNIGPPLSSIIGTFTTPAEVKNALVAMVPRNVWALPLSRGLVRVDAMPEAPAERAYPRLPPHHKFNVNPDHREVVVMLEAWIHERWGRVHEFKCPNIPKWFQYPIEFAKLIEQFLATKGGQTDRGHGVFNGNPAGHVIEELGELVDGERVFTFVGEKLQLKNPGARPVQHVGLVPGGGRNPVVVGDRFGGGGMEHTWCKPKGRLCKMFGLGLMKTLEVVPRHYGQYKSCTINLALCDAECTNWDGPTAELVVPAQRDTAWLTLETRRTAGIRKVHAAYAEFVKQIHRHRDMAKGKTPLWHSTGDGQGAADDEDSDVGSDGHTSNSGQGEDATDGGSTSSTPSDGSDSQAAQERARPAGELRRVVASDTSNSSGSDSDT